MATFTLEYPLLSILALFLLSQPAAARAPDKIDALIYYTKQGAHLYFLEWGCRTNRHLAVRDEVERVVDLHTSRKQAALLRREFDRELGRFGVDMPGSAPACDRETLYVMRGELPKSATLIVHPERMTEKP